jgi:hypothetical protein
VCVLTKHQKIKAKKKGSLAGHKKVAKTSFAIRHSQEIYISDNKNNNNNKKQTK